VGWTGSAARAGLPLSAQLVAINHRPRFSLKEVADVLASVDDTAIFSFIIKS
jgi:hypothetical protein